MNFSNADYLERRRLVDDTPLVSNASNNRKILADIFGEPGKLLSMNFSHYYWFNELINENEWESGNNLNSLKWSDRGLNW